MHGTVLRSSSLTQQQLILALLVVKVVLQPGFREHFKTRDTMNLGIHRILDLVLQYVLGFFFPIWSWSPDINYKFIDEILEQYDLQNA